MKQILSALLFFLCMQVALKAQNRVALIEQFSNSSCGPCGAISPFIYSYADNNSDDVVVVAYHTLFPYNNDSMYFENPIEASQRVNYYSVNGVPYSILDGNVYSGSTNPFATNVSTFVNNRLSVTPRYDIEVASLSLSGSQLSGSFKFVSANAMNASENLIAHVVVIEKNVLKSAYATSPGANSETQYGYVMRKMIPDANGTTLVNTSFNGIDHVSFNWTLNHIKDKAEMRVVAFVQNKDTKEVYQAQLFSIQGTPTGLNKMNYFKEGMNVWPNPAHDEISISFDMDQFVRSISIADISGSVWFSKEVQQTSKILISKLNLVPGIYYMTVFTSTQEFKKKLIIIN